jgi:tRNA (guanine-N7-)-methyltransferase
MRKKKLITAEIGNYPSWIYPELADPRLFLPWLREKIRGKKSIHLELGMGTGDFLICKALEYPDSFFLGVDTKDYRLMQAMKKAKHLGLQNIAFLQAPIENLMSYQIPMVDHLYLLFSDPWPKRKHAERRLTHRGFLKLYEQIMNPSAQMLFKPMTCRTTSLLSRNTTWQAGPSEKSRRTI